MRARCIFVPVATIIVVLHRPYLALSEREQPGAAMWRASIDGRLVTVRSPKNEFSVELPQEWLDWHAQFKNNFHLTRDELKRAEKGEGEWDLELAEVVNSALPFGECIAQVGGDGWGRQSVAYDAIHLRVYVVGNKLDGIERKLKKRGVAKAKEFSDRVSVATSETDGWHRVTLSFRLWYGDYGGIASVDAFFKTFNGHGVALVFVHGPPSGKRQDARIREIVKSFRWREKQD